LLFLLSQLYDAIHLLPMNLERQYLFDYPPTPLWSITTNLTKTTHRQQGGKNRRRGKNENDDEKRELVFKEDGQGWSPLPFSSTSYLLLLDWLPHLATI